MSQQLLQESSWPSLTKEEEKPILSSTAQFEHVPLCSERSIRLIKLLPETPTGVPQCTLISTSLDKKVPFIALSYTWGDPILIQKNEECEASHQIFCNGRFLAVTRNLYEFLKRAKPGGSESWLSDENKLWIDAICINQHDFEERSTQVKLMSEIYKTAKSVLVWLGEDRHDNAQYAVELLNAISIIPPDKLKELKKLQIHDSRMSEVLGDCGGSAKHWFALKELCSRTWFSRVWIIQEVAYSEDVLVLCGSHYCSWDSCVKVCDFLTYSVVNIATQLGIPYTGWHTEVMFSCRALVKKSQPLGLMGLLRLTRGFDATNPRDKVFAILGLSALANGTLPATNVIQIDYERTPEEVYLETAWALIENSDDLIFLVEVEDPWYRRMTDLPTWVPEFSVTTRPHIYFQSATFNADKGLKVSLNRLPNNRLLGTAAYRIGKINGATHLGSNESFISYFPRVITLISSLAPVYISGEDKVDVLWRTLIQNGCDWISPAATEVADDFRNWILLNIATAAREARNNGSGEERVNSLISQLQTCSLTVQTRLIPSEQDVEDVIRQHQNGQTFEHAGSASKYELELAFYNTMRLFKTDGGLLGLGPWSLQPGDSLWVIPGVCVPMVLRSTAINDHLNVIGPAYVHGILNGEALEGDRLQQESIVLE